MHRLRSGIVAIGLAILALMTVTSAQVAGATSTSGIAYQRLAIAGQLDAKASDLLVAKNSAVIEAKEPFAAEAMRLPAAKLTAVSSILPSTQPTAFSGVRDESSSATFSMLNLNHVGGAELPTGGSPVDGSRIIGEG